MSALFENVQAVFFDLFDTLIRIDLEQLPSVTVEGRSFRSTLPLVYERHLAQHDVPQERFLAALRDAMVEIMERKRQSWVEVSASERWGLVVERLERFEGEEADELAGHLTEAHARLLASAAIPVEGAHQLLSKVRDRGLATALISNFDHAPAADWILEITELDGFLEKRVVSEALGVRKPHERMFLEALEHFDVTPEQSVHVGDQPKPDAWGAGRLGLHTVWINPKAADYPEDEHPPTLVVEELAELESHL